MFVILFQVRRYKSAQPSSSGNRPTVATDVRSSKSVLYCIRSRAAIAPKQTLRAHLLLLQQQFIPHPIVNICQQSKNHPWQCYNLVGYHGCSICIMLFIKGFNSHFSKSLGLTKVIYKLITFIYKIV